jgi:hypothetical protein
VPEFTALDPAADRAHNLTAVMNRTASRHVVSQFVALIPGVIYLQSVV